jgi:hypothetical protein
MAGPPSPERASGWINTLLPLAQQGGPLLTVFTLMVGTVIVYWLLGALDRQQTLTRELGERLLTCVEQRGELAWKYRAPAAP